MPLDPEIAQVLQKMAAAGGPPMHEVPIAQARAAAEVTSLELGGPGEEVGDVRDAVIASAACEIPVRVYRPKDAPDGPLPVVAWFHGGGWALGSLDSFDPLMRGLTNASGALVVNVGYRLAPEHPFPAALEDAVCAARWLLEHAGELGGDPERVAVGGDSAGGNLATVAARRLRDAGGPLPRFQALVYPVADGSCSTASYRACGQGYGLTGAGMRRYFELYTGGTGDQLDPDISPLRAGDLSGLPPAYVLTCEYDPLRDEGEAYARALEEAGVPVTLRRWDGTVHGFFRWLAVAAAARRAVAECGAALRAALG